MKILFFIEALGFGGKERRLMELIHYLRQNTDFSLAMVLTEERIHFKQIYDLNVQVRVIKRKGIKRDPRLFKEFYDECVEFKPDIIHTWGFMTTFYAIPAKVLLGIPLVSSMITVAKRDFKALSLNNLFFRLSCLFSNLIISNSKAGLRAFNVNSKKAKVIYNGVRLERFHQQYHLQQIRDELGIQTSYVVVMVATFSRFKDYNLFLDVACEISKFRSDITFMGVGGGPDWDRIDRRIKNEGISNVVLTGRQSDVEKIIIASDIGLLCTFSEGISNSIIEYMALAKPVVVTDTSGGSGELIIDGVTGYCLPRDVKMVVSTISKLLDNKNLSASMGQKGRERIESNFSIERMGKEFVDLYKTV